MLHIRLQDLRLPPGWETRARTALDKIRQLPPAERADAINRRARIWRALTTALTELSEGKCWYCESRQIRSDKVVDHYRPKNAVIECPGHGGYWWLAFDWHNYRLSCGYCNSRHNDVAAGSKGGKHDHFPLLNPAARAYQESDDLGREEAELLDPTN